ncbi:MAG: peptide methionine sulfoxide reductase [Winogradskyella sp.]|nr:MAG: peptide methionine sulfoxide reductase [Winogradskyella sp.]
MLLKVLNKIDEGYSEGYYNSKKYGMTKTTYNKGKSIKFYAEELGGNDFVSLNYYITNNEELLKPCEMEEKKVIRFLNNVKIYSK